NLSLLQAEKEERRLRRVLANRESARQTIRRRQALREELTRKVASLSLENENMRMQKDVAMKEYLSLKDTNEHLKEQV
ncbi:bZIP transcription factor, partial [Musa troglodytarum]